MPVRIVLASLALAGVALCGCVNTESAGPKQSYSFAGRPVAAAAAVPPRASSASSSAAENKAAPAPEAAAPQAAAAAAAAAAPQPVATQTPAPQTAASQTPASQTIASQTAEAETPTVAAAADGSIPVGAPIVEFRARVGPDIIGHTYLIFGHQGADGSIIEPTQVGLYPKELSGFAIGVGGMAEATTEPVALDLSLPPSAVYRRQLTDEEYARLSAAVEAARADPPTWNWTRYNCNTFVADMAKAVGLKTPMASTLLAPAIFITQLKALNS